MMLWTCCLLSWMNKMALELAACDWPPHDWFAGLGEESDGPPAGGLQSGLFLLSVSTNHILALTLSRVSLLLWPSRPRPCLPTTLTTPTTLSGRSSSPAPPAQPSPAAAHRPPPAPRSPPPPPPSSDGPSTRPRRPTPPPLPRTRPPPPLPTPTLRSP